MALDRIGVAMPRHIPREDMKASEQHREHLGVLPCGCAVGVNEDEGLGAARMLVVLPPMTVDGDESILDCQERWMCHEVSLNS